MKKILCCFLAFFTICSALSGCGNPVPKESVFNKEIADKLGDTGGLKLPLSKENVEIEWSVTTDSQNFEETWIANKLREVTGIDIKFRSVTMSSFQDKLNVWIASKDLPDIVGQGFQIAVANDLAAQGALAAVEDYIDVLPNFKSKFVDDKENNWIFQSYAAPHDGKLYGFYGYDWARDVNHGMLYRKDIFDKHNIPMWNNPDEFYETMKKLKELYPDSTPFTSKNTDGLFQKLSNSWGIMAFKPYYDETTGKWKYTDTDEKYKEMLDFIKKLYDEKLLDPEFLTLTQAAWTSKMTQNEKAFVTFDWIGRLDMFKLQASDLPEYDLRYANPIGPNQTVAEADQICFARYVSNTDNAEVAFKLLDFALSPAGKELITMGIEGETYTLDENNRAKYIEYTYSDAENTPDMSKLLEKYGMFTEGLYLGFDRRSAYFTFSEREQEAQEYVKDPSKVDPIDPILPFTAKEQEMVNELQTELDTAGREFAAQYILSSKASENDWENWVEKANNLGAEKLIKIYNDAQIRFDSK